MHLKQRLITAYVLLAAALFFPVTSHAVLTEQVAIDTRAMSLANTCTADPPGLMSVHYNPAGLSLLPEGKTFSNSLTLVHIERTGRFNADPEWPGLMNGTWGPDPDKWPDTYSKETDPNSDHGGPDPLDGSEYSNSGYQMYVPFYGTIPFLAAPTLGISSRKKNSPWTFAYANYPAAGAGLLHEDEGDPYQYGVKSMYLQHLVYAAPSASYRVSNSLSLGVSVGLGQQVLGVETNVRTPNELVALTRVIGDATKDLNIPVVSQQTLPPPWLGGGLGPYAHDITLKLDELRDDFSPTYNLGLLWRPREWFSFGLTYQSEAVAELSGKYQWQYSDQFQKHVNWNSSTEMTLQSAGMLDLPTNGVPYQEGTVTTTNILPQSVHTGIMLKPVSRLKLLFDVHWANWSVVKENRFTFDQDIQLLKLAKMMGYTEGNRDFVVNRDMKDTWHWSAGLEYDVTDHLTVRAGYERRPSSLNMEQFDVLFFLPDATLYGAGVGLKLPKDVHIDLSLACLLADDIAIDNNESTNLNSTDFTRIGNMFAGLDYEQEAAIYMVSFKVTMPLEVQMEHLHHQMEMVKHLFSKLNPFKKEKHDTSH
ncbi:hypothetical protein DSLASN_11880 [Desulfoluna limicola]|uniref:Membrane protein involved in aromatic hydrocarbon degradation n=1 Tax=Desulfoluna limicola TaxID=2810562 RepID=A0ABN6F225_9BACT|nr:hypothetical protein DSLASN_11880 [Desulfoluna limicola]